MRMPIRKTITSLSTSAVIRCAITCAIGHLSSPRRSCLGRSLVTLLARHTDGGEAEAGALEHLVRRDVIDGDMRDDAAHARVTQRPVCQRLRELGAVTFAAHLVRDRVADLDSALGSRWTEIAAGANELGSQ